MGTTKNKVSKEVAIGELGKFLFAWNWEESASSDAKLESDYPNIIKAIEQGRLSFDDKYVPTLELTKPVGETTKITFRTRVKPSVQASLAKGLKLETDTLTYALRVLSYITDLALGEIDELSKEDYAAAQQIASVFS